MRMAKEEVDIKMEIPGAVIRQRTDFGDATGLGKISGEYFSLSAGVDTTPLFQGLEGNLCQCPHWGYVVRGKVTFRYAEHDEVYESGDAYYAPPGHVPFISADTEIVEFSPTGDYEQTMEVVGRNLAALAK